MGKKSWEGREAHTEKKIMSYPGISEDTLTLVSIINISKP